MYIEDIALDHFSVPTHTETSVKPQARIHHSLFTFFSYDSKQDFYTNIAHSKHIIELLNQRNILSNTLSKI